MHLNMYEEQITVCIHSLLTSISAFYYPNQIKNFVFHSKKKKKKDVKHGWPFSIKENKKLLLCIIIVQFCE